MKKLLILAIAFAIILPLSTEAKSLHQSAKLSKTKARATTISASLLAPKPSTAGKPVLNTLTLSSNSKIESAIDLYPTMAIIRIEPAKPFYMFARAKSVELKLSALTPGATYYLYKEKLRDPVIFTADISGSYSLDLDTPRHRYLILKTKKSTWHIDDDSTGGECEGSGFPLYRPAIGTWNATTKTCTLLPTSLINETIEIDDSGITIDGGNRVINHTSDFGIYANTNPLEPTISNITIKNMTIRGVVNGITLIDVLNATIDNVTIDNTTTKGIDLKDTTTATIRNGTIKNTTTAFDADNVTGVLVYRNNFIANTNDLASAITGGVLLSTVADRGNFWDENADCGQGTGATQDYCTRPYDATAATDARPWACENGWLSTVTCPTVVVPPIVNTGNYGNCADGGEWAEVKTTSGYVIIRETASPSARNIKELPAGWVLHLEGDTTGGYSKIKDQTDNLTGWLITSELCTNPAREEEFLQRIESLSNPGQRKNEVIEAINFYLNDSSNQEQLYSSGGTKRGGGPLNIKELVNNHFPSDLYLAMLAEEGGATSGREGGEGGAVVTTSWNNEHKTWDGGYGITQITSVSKKGIASRLKLFDEKCEEFRQVYVGYLKSYIPEYLCDIYTNSSQGIYANIKDGLYTLYEKFDTYDSNVNLEPTDKQWATSTGVAINNSDLKNLLALRGYNGFGPKCHVFQFGTINEQNAEQVFYEQYITRVAEELLNLRSTYDNPSLTSYSVTSELYRKINLAYKNRQEICIKSPATLSITDESAKVTGIVNGSLRMEIAEVVYDTELGKAASIVFPQGQYSYLLTGTDSGTYTAIFQSFQNSTTPTEFVAQDISTEPGEKHLYRIDWKKLSLGQQGVSVSVDRNNDGIYEIQFTADNLLTSTEFNSQLQDKKVTICHRPPGNANNAHTITVGQPVVRAHLAHGDTIGECGSSTMATTTTTSVKTSPGQVKKELNTAGGGFVPPGQTKKKK